MDATNQCSSEDFVFIPAEAQTQYVLLIQPLLLVSKYYVTLSELVHIPGRFPILT